MNAQTGRGDHGGDAGHDVPDVGQTSREDLGQSSDDATDDRGPQDDDISSGHLGEPGGPGWSQQSD